MNKHKRQFFLLNFFIAAIIFSLGFSSCTKIDLYEKTVPVPDYAWQNSFKPVFNFTIKDTTSLYKIFLVLRHNEKYNYSNIYVNLYVQGPGQDTAQKIRQNVELATNEKGWLGTGVDDIYEQRRPLGDRQYLKAGEYKFTLEQIMRENPLQNILDVGIRVEKEQ